MKEKVVAKPQSSGAKCAITDEAVVKCPNLVLSSYPRRYYIQGHRLTATGPPVSHEDHEIAVDEGNAEITSPLWTTTKAVYYRPSFNNNGAFGSMCQKTVTPSRLGILIKITISN